MKSKSAVPGILAAEGESITFRQGEHHWTVPLDAIVAIGEATNQSGPFADDWFICLMTGPEGHWFEAPVYASGVQETLKWLSGRFGEPIELGLANSTDLKSQVLWPPTLRGRQMFEYSAPKPVGWQQRILKRCRLWPWTIVRRVHSEVLREVRARTV